MATDDGVRRDFFEARGEFEVPVLAELDLVENVETASESFEETHFDTEGGHLAGYGIELIRRKGGSDPGWHLVLAEANGAPIEVTFESRATSAPREASAMLYAVRGGQRLAPSGRLAVRRDTHQLFAAEGELVGVVHTHQHTATDPHGVRADEVWSAVAVESFDTSPEGLHKKLAKSVRTSGADKATGVRTRPVEGLAADRPTPKRLAGLVDEYAQAQLAHLALADLGLRRGEDTVHDARLAIRRLRTTLEVFGDVFEDEWSTRLQDDLSWFGAALGRVRDVDVAAARASNPTRLNEFASDATNADLDRIWVDSRNAAVEALETVLVSRRYQAMIEELDVWRTERPYAKAGDKSRKTARTYVQAARKDLDRKLRKATRSDADDATMHKARKAAKRLRYAAELTAPVLDKPNKIRKEARYLQRSLGDLQDSRIAIDYLVDAASTGGEPSTAFTLGWLVAQEQAVTDQIRTVLRHSLR